MLYPAIAANQTMIAIVPTVRLIGWVGARNTMVEASIRPIVAIGMISAIRTIVRIGPRTKARRCCLIAAMLYPAIAADQTMIPIVTAIRLIGWIRARNIMMESSVRPIVAIGVISAVWTIVRIGAG